MAEDNKRTTASDRRCLLQRRRGYCERLAQHKRSDIASLSAQSHANAKLIRSARDAIGNNSVQSNAAIRQANTPRLTITTRSNAPGKSCRLRLSPKAEFLDLQNFVTCRYVCPYGPLSNRVLRVERTKKLSPCRPANTPCAIPSRELHSGLHHEPHRQFRE